MDYTHKIEINGSRLLAVLNHPYQIKDDLLEINLYFADRPSTKEAFILPNEDIGISIASSTSVIDHAQWQNGQLKYKVLSPGIQEILWDKKHGKSMVSTFVGLDYIIDDSGDYFRVIVTIQTAELNIVLKAEN